MQLRLAILTFAALLAGCESHQEKKHQEQAALSYMIYSPNGEPLNGGPLGRPTCQQALSGWFDRISAGSGHIAKEAFLQDARVQFARMDVDHNGYIVSEELDRFREPYRQKPLPALHQSSGETGESQEGQKRGRRQGKSGGDKGSSNSLSDPSLSQSDPVMSADINLDFKVTLQEFMQQAEDSFAKLDANHDGTLDLAESTAQCEKKR